MAYRQQQLPTTARPFTSVPPSNVITQMQPGHGFTTQAADASSSLNDTTNFVIGAQAATLVTAGAGATTYLLHKGLSAVDMTSRQFVVVIECDDPAHVSSGTFQFLAGTGASTSTTYQWQLYTAGDIPQNVIQAGRWTCYVLNFADAAVNGSPTRSAITDYYIRLNDDNTGNKVTVRVNAVYAVPNAAGLAPYARNFPNGAATVCFDDGFSSQMTAAKPVMDSNNLTASMFIIWDAIGQSGRLTQAQLLQFQDVSGWDINAHSMTDADHSTAFAALSAAELESNITSQQQIMASQGFQGQGTAYPKGEVSPAAIGLLRKYFQYARGTSNKTLETLPVTDMFNLRAVSSISPVSGGYSPALISQSSGLIDKTVTEKRWLILTFHKVIGNVTSVNSTTGTTYRVIYSDTSPPYNTGTTVTLAGFTPSGLNGTYTITATGTAGGFGYADVNVGSTPGNATVMGTALSATTDCDLASFTAIINKLVSSGVTVLTMADMMKCLYPSSGGLVTGVTAADASVAVSGTATAPALATGTLDAIATAHPPVAAVAMNSQKLTGLANGSASSDSAAFGQIPTSLPPNGTAGGALSGSYPNPGIVLDSTAGDIQPVGTAAAGGAIGKPADAGHVHTGLSLVAATAVGGYALVNGTGNVITWTTPNDGNMHHVMVMLGLLVTSTETGGSITVGLTLPNGTTETFTPLAGSLTSGYQKASSFGTGTFLVKAGTAVTVAQGSALTSGASVLWASIWGL